jgi:hypothetical protein
MPFRITHPRPQLGRQNAFQIDFRDGVATVDTLHPERELALRQHGYEVAEIIEGTKLEDVSVKDLRDLADQHGVDLPSRAKKADIIAAINASPNIAVTE